MLLLDENNVSNYLLLPAKHFVISDEEKEKALKAIEAELLEYAPTLKPLERQRLEQRTSMI